MDQGYIDVEYRETETDVTDADADIIPVGSGDSLALADTFTYEELTVKIEGHLQSLKKSFLSIGYYLKIIRDRKLYHQDGYRNIYEFADDRLHLTKSTTSRMIGLCEQFSAGHNSPRIDENYAEYNYSQLTELLPLEPEQREQINAEMTVKQIQAKKRELREAEKKKKEVPQNDLPETAVSETAAQETAALEAIMPEAVIPASKIPPLKNKTERLKWLEQAAEWDGGLWYEDENIGAQYYKTDFPDGCRLIAVRYRRPLSAIELEASDEETCYSGFFYHMIYSEWYLQECPRDEYIQKSQKNFMEATADIDELLSYLSQINQTAKDRRYVEFDTGKLKPEDDTDKSIPYLTKRYMKFYREKGYIPKYFNPYGGKGDFEVAPTLTTSSSSFSGIGSMTFFNLESNIQELLNDRTADPGRSEDAAIKLQVVSSRPRNDAETKERKKLGSIRFFVTKPTAIQCLELMGFTPENVDRDSLESSDSVLIKALGNGIEQQTLGSISRQIGKYNDSLDSPDSRNIPFRPGTK